MSLHTEALGKSILLGRPSVIQEKMRQLSLSHPEDLLIHDPTQGEQNKTYGDFLYERALDKTFSLADCYKMIQQNPLLFGACMFHFGLADGMVTGLTHTYEHVYDNIRLILDVHRNTIVFGLSISC